MLLKKNFNYIGGIGCYFHFCKLILEHIKKYKLKKIKKFYYDVFFHDIAGNPIIKENQLYNLKNIKKKYLDISEDIKIFLII